VISGSLSKPPPSASRPPHRASASIRDNYTCTETLDRETVKVTCVQTIAFGANCNYTTALCRRLTTCLGTAVWAHSWAHPPRFSLGLFQKTEGKGEKAAVSLTAAFFTERSCAKANGTTVRSLDDLTRIEVLLQPENRARKSAHAYHQCVVLSGARRIWTATRMTPPTTYTRCGRPRIRPS
jgi:hypothetical protein